MQAALVRPLPRRARLVVEAPLERVDVPDARLVRHTAAPRQRARKARGGAPRAGTRAEVAAGEHLLLDLGHGPSFLVIDAAPGARVKHRLRRPRTAPGQVKLPHVALEPIGRGYHTRVLAVVHRVEGAQLDDAAAPLLAVLRPGNRLAVAPGVAFAMTLFHGAALVDFGAAHPPGRCGVCRGRIEAGMRALACDCGALVHAGWAPPIATLDPPYHCADDSGCPECSAPLPAESGYQWLPEVPFEARAGEARPRSSRRGLFASVASALPPGPPPALTDELARPAEGAA